MSKKTDEKQQQFRTKLAETFIKALNEYGLEWKCGWHKPLSRPINGISKRKYSGVNEIYLWLVALIEGYNDYRWCTFNQARKNGWHVKKGSESTSVEYHYWYDTKERCALTWPQFFEGLRIAQAKGQEAYADYMAKLRYCTKYFNVFNFCQIEGAPEKEEFEPTDVVIPHKVEEIALAMGVEIKHDDIQNAFYDPKRDYVNLPPAENFFSQEEHDATALHELVHATGAESRLNRTGIIQSPPTRAEYAFEELIAEIGSTLAAEEFGLPTNALIMENHKAYVQSWIKATEENADVIYSAVAEAEKACDFIHKLLDTETHEQNVA